MFISEDVKQKIIIDYRDNQLSLRDVLSKYNLKSKDFLRTVVLKGFVRSYREGLKIVHKKHPEKFKHSEETKEKIRTARLRFMKEHPEETAWRQTNLSYPESCFLKIIKECCLDKKFLIVREYSIYPYFIDFAFVDLKVAVEIDGSQHLNKDRKDSDLKKDELLKSLGWRVLRITAKDVMKNKDFVIEELNRFLGDSNVKYKKVGILKYAAQSYYVKKERDENGLTEKQKQNAINQRKVKNRPSKEELWNLIQNKSFVQIGKTFGVTDNTIRKWCRYYGLPSKRKDIKNAVVNVF